MQAKVVKPSMLASQPEPNDEETLKAMLLLLKRLMPKPADSAAAAVGSGIADSWLSPSTAAEYAAVSEDTLRTWISSGQLRAGRVGRVIRIRRSDIDALLAGEATGSRPSAATKASGGDAGPASDTSRVILTSLRRKSSTKT